MSKLDGDDSLICPITQEYFRDPVIAEDGRLYEREAITRWINEHGTSPFTRQVLNVNHLQPDDVIRQKAEQRRRLSVSYNQQSDQVQLPPVPILCNMSSHTITIGPMNINTEQQLELINRNHYDENIRPRLGNITNIRNRHWKCTTDICNSSELRGSPIVSIYFYVGLCILIPIVVFLTSVNYWQISQSISTTNNSTGGTYS